MFEKYNISKMPGHWFLSRMGKRVLRPGGRELTSKMLEELNISQRDEVVEFAPGMGVTAKLIFDKKPQRYWGVDQNEEAIEHLQSISPQEEYTFLKENIIRSGLKENIASVLLGEAVLTMQTEANKQKIINKAYRILRKGGRYGIHEIGIIPDNISVELKDQLRKELSATIHVNARPLTLSEWTAMLEKAGFHIQKIHTSPMHLLELPRLVQDEGVSGLARISGNILKTRGAWSRLTSMRSVFRKYAKHMNAVSIIAVKGS